MDNLPQAGYIREPLNYREGRHAQLAKSFTGSALIYDGFVNFNNDAVKGGKEKLQPKIPRYTL